MSTVKNGDQVKVHYTGKLTDGSVFDSSANREPLGFTVGAGQMIKGFDAGVVGMAVGDKKTLELQPEEAYGPHDATRVMEVPKDKLPQGMEPQLGMKLGLTTQQGQQIPATIVEVNEGNIKIDANHELAGKVLIFELELVSID